MGNVLVSPTCRLRSAFRRLASEERGIALVMALMMMTVLGIAGGGAAYYTVTNLHSAHRSKANTNAYSAAEAGMNAALAYMYGQLDSDGAPWVAGTTDSNGVYHATAGISPKTQALFTAKAGPAPGDCRNVASWTTTSSGDYRYCGTLVVSGTSYVWQLRSEGRSNDGQRYQTRAVTKSITVRGINDGADAVSWTRFYQDNPNTCLTIDGVDVPANIATRGGICIRNGGKITGSGTTVDVGGNVTVEGPPVDTAVTYASSGTGSGWTNSNNARTNDGTYATNSIAVNSSGATLVVSGFGFNIPSTAYIKGVDVEIERKAGSSSSLYDEDVFLRKSTGSVGTDHKNSSSYWSTSDSLREYGGSTDLWGTTWTPAEINSSSFGVALRATNDNNSVSVTASVDFIRITVTYTGDTTEGVGTAAQGVKKVHVAGSCKFNNAATWSRPCGTADKVYSQTTPTTVPEGLDMPDVDLDYWFQNAKPGPKHPCTNANTNMAPLVFDNDNSTNWNDSLQFNDDPRYDITPAARSYSCQFVENGQVVGELSWNSNTHALTVSGTLFFDGDVRFDDDGIQAVNYHGRAIIYAAGNIEFDEVVCAGGSATTASNSCIMNGQMSNWNPSGNMLVLLSNGNSQYDQGGTTCSPSGSTWCPNGRYAGGFQGVVYAKGSCNIQERFHDSGPVICNTITISAYDGSTYSGNPTIYAFPSLGELVEGQKYSDTSTATAFELVGGYSDG